MTVIEDLKASLSQANEEFGDLKTSCFLKDEELEKVRKELGAANTVVWQYGAKVDYWQGRYERLSASLPKVGELTKLVWMIERDDLENDLLKELYLRLLKLPGLVAAAELDDKR